MIAFSQLDIRRLLDYAHIGIVIHKWDSSVVYANPTSLRLLRLSYEQIIGKDEFDPSWHFVDESLKRLSVTDYPINKVKRSKQSLENEMLGVLTGEHRHISWFLVNAYLEGGQSEQDNFIVVTFNDVTESVKMFSFQEIVENTQDIVIVTEAQNIEAPLGPKIIYVNKAFERLTGYSAEEVLGETPRLLQGHHTSKDSRDRIFQALQQQQPITETILNYSKSGRPYWLEMNIIPLFNKDGAISHFAAIERDVTERLFHLEQIEKRNADLKALKDSLEQLVAERTKALRDANIQLELLAFTDQLTGAPNRRQFQDQAQRILKFCQRYDNHVLVGLIDIDNFKQVNDQFGHDVGDQALKLIATCLMAFFRQDDSYCRYGGEEFAFVATVQQTNNCELLLQRLLNAIRQVRVSEQPELRLTVSIGAFVTIPKPEVELSHFLKLADKMLYNAKQAGKDCAQFTID